MLNTLRVDFKRYMMTKVFLIMAVIFSIAGPVFMNISVNLFADAIKAEKYIGIDSFWYYSANASIYLAVIITMFLNAEAGEGIIRNKLISGKKRYQVLISYCLVNTVVATILELLSVISAAVVGVLSGAVLRVSVDEIIRYTLVATLAGIAIGILYTAVYICFCTKKIANVIPIAIAMLVKIAMIVISDALFTTSGVPKVTGTTLKIYTGIDRYFAFFHLNNELRYDNMSYIIGNAALIIISILVGSLVFTKKDFQ